MGRPPLHDDAKLKQDMVDCLWQFGYDAPISAAINEAVELTRKYENEDVVSFVNGILGGFAREVQQSC